MSGNFLTVYEARVRSFDPATKVATVVMPGPYGMEPIEAPPFVRQGSDFSNVVTLVVGDRVLVTMSDNEPPEWIATNADWLRIDDQIVIKPNRTINDLIQLHKYAPTDWAYMSFWNDVGDRRGYVGVAPDGDIYLTADYGELRLYSAAAVYLTAGASSSVYVDALSLVLGASVSSGPRHRLHIPATGNIMYYDFEANGGAAATQFQFRAGTSGVLTLEDTVIRPLKPVWAIGQMRVAGTAQSLILIDDGNGPYMGFYDGTTPDSYGSRKGYVGFASASGMYVNNESAVGHLYLLPGASGDLILGANHVERARIDNIGHFLWGKTSLDLALAGGQFDYTNSRMGVTSDSVNAYNFRACHIGSGNAAGSRFMDFTISTLLTLAGNITQTSGGDVAYNTTSHGPFKDEMQDLDGDAAITLVEKWRPVSYRWKRDADGNISEDGVPTGDRVHGFDAQEMHKVSPSAVTPGRGKWADHLAWVQARRQKRSDVDDISPFEPWSMDYSKLVPDLCAAVQGLIRRVHDQGEEIAELRRMLPA